MPFLRHNVSLWILIIRVWTLQDQVEYIIHEFQHRFSNHGNIGIICSILVSTHVYKLGQNVGSGTMPNGGLNMCEVGLWVSKNVGSGTLGSKKCGKWDFKDAVSPPPPPYIIYTLLLLLSETNFCFCFHIKLQIITYLACMLMDDTA